MAAWREAVLRKLFRRRGKLLSEVIGEYIFSDEEVKQRIAKVRLEFEGFPQTYAEFVELLRLDNGKEFPVQFDPQHFARKASTFKRKELVDEEPRLKTVLGEDGNWTRVPSCHRNGAVRTKKHYKVVQYHLGEEFEEALRLILELYLDFIKQLRTGAVQSYAYESAYKLPKPLRASIWAEDDVCFDLLNNRLCRVVDGKSISIVSGVCIGSPVEKEASGQEERKSPGPKGKYVWEEAFELLVIDLGKQGHPETGAELTRMLIGCFERIEGAYVPDEDQAKDWLKRKHQKLWKLIAHGEGGN